MYIALLRGINVNGKNLITMDALKTVLHGIGFSSITTYLQSGNLVFKYQDTDKNNIEKIIQNALLSEWGMSVSVFVFDSFDWQKIINNNPFTTDHSKETSFLHCTLIHPPLENNVETLTWNNKKGDKEAWHMEQNAIYLYCPSGYGNTKLSNIFFEKQLKTTATTRNWKTMLALHELLK